MPKAKRRAGAPKKPKDYKATSAEIAAVSAEIGILGTDVDAIFEPDVYVSDQGLYSKDEITQRALQPVHNHRDVLDITNYGTEMAELIKRNHSWTEKILGLNKK